MSILQHRMLMVQYCVLTHPT